MSTTTKISKMLLTTACTAALAATHANLADAATYAGVRGGVQFDAEDPLVGAELVTSMSDGWWFNPNVEHTFREGNDMTSINADVHRDFPAGETTSFWLGAGPALIFRDRPGNDDVDLGLNGLMGVGWSNAGGVMPYVQGKVVFSDDVDGSLGIGIRF